MKITEIFWVAYRKARQESPNFDLLLNSYFLDEHGKLTENIEKAMKCREEKDIRIFLKLYIKRSKGFRDSISLGDFEDWEFIRIEKTYRW